jgi:DNA topoisomerase-3
VCEHSVGAHVTCDFMSGKIILQQPVAREQMAKLLAGGKTDLLEGFVSNKTRRKFKARLAYDAKEGKVTFEFEPRAPRGPAAKGTGAARASVAAAAPAAAASAGTTLAKKTPARKAPARKVGSKTTAASGKTAPRVRGARKT